MKIFKILRQFANNFNWAQRECDLQFVIRNYISVRDLPLKTKNMITVESFERQKAHHNQIVAWALDKYGNRWSDFLDQYTFG